ncbi:MAG: hypothetical protein ACPLGZ_03755 [Candidatus Pelagibacter ubique]|jgi:hypothetical protein
MTDKERVELIRKGNQLFNEGKIEEAAKIFLETDYKDGLVRVGDHYYFNEKRIFKAFFYYRKANYKKRLEEIYKLWASVIQFLLNEDKTDNTKKHEEKQEEAKIIEGEDKRVKNYEFPKLSKDMLPK